MCDTGVLVRIFNLTSSGALKALAASAVEVDPRTLMPGEFVNPLEAEAGKLGSRGSSIRQQRPEDSLARGAAVGMGEFWFLGATREMPLSADGFKYARILAKKVSLLFRLSFLRAKDRSGLVAAVDSLFVGLLDGFGITFRGMPLNSDPAWIAFGKGGTGGTAELVTPR